MRFNISKCKCRRCDVLERCTNVYKETVSEFRNCEIIDKLAKLFDLLQSESRTSFAYR